MKIGESLPGIDNQGAITRQQGLSQDLDQFSLELEKAAQESDHKLKKAAKQFEAMFVSQMIESMRKTIPESDLLDGGFAEDTYEEMLDQAYSEKIADTKGLGLADKIYKQFTSEKAGLSPEHAIDVKE
ncbi:rod-binding protein [Natranaerobius trueperi]|uniref:Muramidase n=1 Tax=Natranaerobius trueperi TaxID=759412 RepID=A0A226C059_9FIRM|nr:rod-binding protein [Natranaerobius trueperi]OWZ84616.1 muramidase [Natranaerobius trueperi]